MSVHFTSGWNFPAQFHPARGLAVLLLGLGLALPLGLPAAAAPPQPQAQQPQTQQPSPQQPAAAQPDTLQPIQVGARQAFMMDYDTGAVLYAKNADQEMTPSSMTKMMTVYLVFQRLAKGDLKLTDTLPVSPRAWKQGGSKMFVMVGTRVSIDDLLQGVIVQSGNDACIVLAQGLAGNEAAFVEQMNNEAKKLGMTHTHFVDSDGWPEPDHYSSAHDLAILASHLIRDFPQYYHYFKELNFTYDNVRQGNRNPLLYTDKSVDGLKTGHTDAGGYGLTVSAVRDGRRLIAVLNGMASSQERAQDPEALLDWGFRTFDDYTLLKKGQVVAEAPVWLGRAASVPLVLHQNLLVTLPRTARDQVKVTVDYTGPLPAPIATGEKVGTVSVSAPGVATTTRPLYAGATVEKLGPLGRIGAMLTYLVRGDRTK